MEIINMLFCVYEFELGQGMPLRIIFFRLEALLLFGLFALLATVWYYVARED